MIPFFIFNGINSKDRGIIVNSLPSISKPEKRYEEIDVPGRNGKLYIDQKSYETFSYEITCTMMPDSNMRVLSSWLNGEGELILSTELDKFYKAIVKDQIDYEQVYRVCNQFKIHFEIQPIALSVKEKVLFLSEGTTIDIQDSTHEVSPYIKLEGVGEITLSINNTQIAIHKIEEYIEFDCEMEEAFKGEKSCNQDIECAEFPKLQPGKNTISWTGNCTGLTLKYRGAFV